jgi:DNA modification methylase
MAYPTLIELDFLTGQNTPNYIDNCDQYPESLVRYFIENYTKKGQSVFDPFIGFGTTAFVAEETGRIPFGIEADGERFEWGAGQLEHWQNIKHDDAANIAAQDFPEMDFCMTSPPYMVSDGEWNPLYGGDPEYNGYDAYLKRLEFIFAQIATIMKKDALIIVQADNIQGKSYTPLVRDFHHLISKNLKPQAEIIVRWTGEKPEYHKDYEHTHCLVFKKI